MRHARFVVGLALAVQLLGCKDPPQSQTPKPAVQRRPVPLSEQPFPHRAVLPAPPPEEAQLPAPQWEGVPGWLGFAAGQRPVEEGGPSGLAWWSPQHADAEVVLFTEAWANVPAGTKVVAVTRTGQVPLTFRSQKTIRYGCEENVQKAALFDAPSPLNSPLVWVLPPSKAKGAGVALMIPGPVEKGPPPSASWRVADVTLAVTRTEPLKGRLEVRADGEVHATATFEKGYMEGGDKEPIDFSSPTEVGVLLPQAAFALGADGPLLIVLGQRGYEGQGFRLVARPRGAPPRLLKETLGLYYCAF